VLKDISGYLKGKREQVTIELPVNSLFSATESVDRTFNGLAYNGYEGNSAVFSCVSEYVIRGTEPCLYVVDEEANPVDHELSGLLADPNPEMDEARLMQFVFAYMCIGGNCYLHKMRGKYGEVIYLWPYHDAQITPIPGRHNWIEYYLYDIGDGTKVKIPREDIIHFKWPSFDVGDPQKGLSPLKVLGREVDTDNQVSEYVLSILKNGGMPGSALVFPPRGKDQYELTTAEIEQNKARFTEAFTGRNRGKSIVLTGGIEVKRFAQGLEDLQNDYLRRIPETRITAAFRVPAILVGLAAGLDRSTYSNSEQAAAGFTKQTLVPLWRSIQRTFTKGLIERDENVTIAYDLSTVEALQSYELERRKAGESLIDSQLAYYAGEIERDAAVNFARIVHNFTQEEAESLFPEKKNGTTA